MRMTLALQASAIRVHTILYSYRVYRMLGRSPFLIIYTVDDVHDFL
jgi:hypothetical protein